MAAGIDLALGFVEKDTGADIAREVARTLVVHHRRAGGQSQHSALLERDAKSDRVQRVLAFARRHLREKLTIERLADIAHLSPANSAGYFGARQDSHRPVL
jgi:transcriptional regulator GlxA family with amidase domain